MAGWSPGPPLVVVLGATATGKSRLAVELARRLRGEVVSFDASCIYRGLDIGTAKPAIAERQGVPHHLIDTCEPHEAFSAASFVALAEAVLASLRERGVTPVLAGGTGLYLRCLLQGMVAGSAPDAELRRRLADRERRRAGSLHRILRRLDAATAARLPATDVLRLVRAIEHRVRSGRRLSGDQAHWIAPPRYAAAKIGLRLPREERERRIVARVDRMLASGLVDEVRGLLARGVEGDAPAFRALGYREVVAHLEGALSLAEVRHRIVVATRRYAKRQDTWFRREQDVHWLDVPTDERELPEMVERAMMLCRSRGLS